MIIGWKLANGNISSAALLWPRVAGYHVSWLLPYLSAGTEMAAVANNWQLSGSRTGCIMFAVRQLHVEQIHVDVVTAALSAHTLRLTRVSLVTLTFLYVPYTQQDREGGEKEGSYWLLPLLHCLLYFPAPLSSRHACPALMWGDGVQWPEPEISRHSALWLGGLQLTGIAIPSCWPLGIE